MSKLLFDHRPLIIDVDLAKILGLNESIIIQQLHYWIEKFRGNDSHYHEGRTWVFNSIESWQEQFPFWGRNTIVRTFEKLTKEGYVLAGNYNKEKFDKTKWYAINYEKLEEIEKSINPKWVNGVTQNGLTEEPKMGEPIPKTTTETTPKTTTNIYTSESPEYTDEFETFWKTYPRHKEKFKAYKTWKARLKEKADPQQLITAAQNYTAYCKDSKTEEQFIKHPSTFLGPDKPYTEYINYKPTGAIPKNIAKALELVKKAEQEEQEGYKGGSVFD
jgi:hypothetical protein